MSNLPKVMVCVGLLSLVALCGCDDYIENGVKWPADKIPVSYTIDPNVPSNWILTIQTAANVWNAINSSFNFSYGGFNSSGVQVDVINWDNNVNTISVDAACFTADDTADYVLARTVWSYASSSLSMIDCDVVFNPAFNWSAAQVCPSTSYDVQAIMTHEFGHWFFLDDLYAPGLEQLTMYGYCQPGETQKRMPKGSDIAGLQFIY